MTPFRYEHKGIEALHFQLEEFGPWASSETIGLEYKTKAKRDKALKIIRFIKEDKESGFCSYSWKEVLDFLRLGWAEGAEGLLKHKAQLKLPTIEVQDTRRQRARDDYRGSPDTNRLITGRTNGMFRKRERQFSTTMPIISVIQEVGGPWSKEQGQLYWCGATGLLLTEMLENAGYRVELIAATMARNINGYDYVNVSVTLKHPNEGLRMGTLAAGAALASTYRTMFFMAIIKARINQPIGDERIGFSSVCTWDDFHKDNPAWKKGAIILPHNYTAETTEKFLTETIKELELQRV